MIALRPGLVGAPAAGLERQARLPWSVVVGMAIAGCASGTGDVSGTVRNPAGGALHVRVVAHTVQVPSTSIPCWTYVTDGMMAVGQKELTLTVVRDAEETSAPGDPFRFFESVWKLAESGRFVDVGDFTKFAVGGFLGATREPPVQDDHRKRAGGARDAGRQKRSHAGYTDATRPWRCHD